VIKQGVSDWFSVNNTKVTKLKYINEALSSYFTNIRRDLASQIPHQNKPYATYLKQRNTTTIFVRPTYKIITNMNVKKG